MLQQVSVINKFDKKISIMQIVFMYSLLTVIYWMGGSVASLFLYLCLFIWAYAQPIILFSLIGASNYLPAISGVSPLLISLVIMIAVVLFRSLQTGGLKISSLNNKHLFLLLFMMLWTFITGFNQADYSFLSSIITLFICFAVLLIFSENLSIQHNSLHFLMMGVGFGIVMTFLIQLGWDAFQSYHIYRLAIGERADPNSTGLLFAIFCVYAFIQLINNLNYNLKKAVMFLILFVLGLWGLLLTQSRGSVLCCAISIFVYIVFASKKTVTLTGVVSILLIGVIGCIILIASGDRLLGSLFESLEQFILRVETSESSDGYRLYLLEESFNSFFDNPIFGTSLENFKFNAGHIPHNTFSDYMVTNGIVGVVFFVVMFSIPIISYFPKKDSIYHCLPYFCYFICFINILFYSASNEKLVLIFLFILLQTKTQKIDTDTSVVA